MKKPDDDLTPSDNLKRIARENFTAIGQSDVFCVLFNESMVQEVIPLLQMGLAVYLDKPMKVLVEKGVQVPINLRAMATGIEEYDPDDPASLKAAQERLFRDELVK